MNKIAHKGMLAYVPVRMWQDEFNEYPWIIKTGDDEYLNAVQYITIMPLHISNKIQANIEDGLKNLEEFKNQYDGYWYLTWSPIINAFMAHAHHIYRHPVSVSMVLQAQDIESIVSNVANDLYNKNKNGKQSSKDRDTGTVNPE